MILPTREQITIAHKHVIDQFGGEQGILHSNRLVSFPHDLRHNIALGQKDIKQTGAWIGVRLIQNHIFMDGNKRVGLSVMLAFFRMNGYKLDIRSHEWLYNTILGIASSEITLEQMEEIISIS